MNTHAAPVKLGKRQRAILEAANRYGGVTWGWTTGWRASELQTLNERGWIQYDILLDGYKLTEAGASILNVRFG